ncbi:hypothetical protein [Sinisalibacter aestuarii]|uniref:Uncharacterized protein n=1 Tax=Sinisalibacter aestuarii TaxID=2949426 RepID=A0ABQ5LV91_9RHOB|nr:hypothetical protein [Sinisalibacter aestuarii]GKY88907.1 hypothetical protein STA1M1_27760 [Sinisalibacter aestuarii]
MTKLVAVVNVSAWAGFWAFGFLALTADPSDSRSIMIAGALAAMGGGIGMYTFLRCARHCEATGYARAYRRATPSDEADGTA